MSYTIDTALKFREKNPNLTIIDVYYNDLVSDPIATVRNIYRKLEIPFTQATETQLNKYCADNAQHKHGINHHDLNKYGLSKQYIDKIFHNYIRKFNVNDKDDDR